jgi:hypothetical protein
MLHQVIELCFVGWKFSATGAKLSKKVIGPGRLPTASELPAARRVSRVVFENRHVIIDELQLASSLCHATIHAMILVDLKTKKVRANWITTDLMSEQRERRVLNCQELLVLQNKDQTDSLPD